MTARGRPTKLDDDTIERISFNVSLGLRLETAARASGVGPRSLRRWIRQGRAELDALSPAGKLVIELDRARREARQLRWEDAAEALERIAPTFGSDRY